MSVSATVRGAVGLVAVIIDNGSASCREEIDDGRDLGPDVRRDVMVGLREGVLSSWSSLLSSEVVLAEAAGRSFGLAIPWCKSFALPILVRMSDPPYPQCASQITLL